MLFIIEIEMVIQHEVNFFETDHEYIMEFFATFMLSKIYEIV